MKVSTTVTLILAQVAGAWASALSLFLGLVLGDALVARGAPVLTPTLDVSVAVVFVFCSVLAWKLAIKGRNLSAILAMGAFYAYSFAVMKITA